MMANWQKAGLHRPNPVAQEKPRFIGFFALFERLAEREGFSPPFYRLPPVQKTLNPRRTAEQPTTTPRCLLHLSCGNGPSLICARFIAASHQKNSPFEKPFNLSLSNDELLSVLDLNGAP
jgi:hypothetical protein